MTAPDDGVLTLTVAGKQISGWESIRVTRGVERFPSDFDIAMASPVILPFKAGDPCTLDIDGDLVLTGYIDRRMPSISARQHAVRVVGRGKCQDLADCSAILPNMVVTTGTLLQLANDLAKPFNITASSLTGDNVPINVPEGMTAQFSVLLTETPYEIIERVARYIGILVYEGTDGNLILAGVGASDMASGFALGKNVQAASSLESMDERFSEYHPSLLAADVYWQMGTGGNTLPIVTDDKVPRRRPLYIVSEQPFQGRYLASVRAAWERNRRFGRSHTVRLTCDSWRDSKRQLWRPNTRAPLDLEEIGVKPPDSDPWLISEVSFMRDISRGTTAEITMMPKEAFTPEPVPLVGVEDALAAAIRRDLHGTGAAP